MDLTTALEIVNSRTTPEQLKQRVRVTMDAQPIIRKYTSYEDLLMHGTDEEIDIVDRANLQKSVGNWGVQSGKATPYRSRRRWDERTEYKSKPTPPGYWTATTKDDSKSPPRRQWTTTTKPSGYWTATSSTSSDESKSPGYWTTTTKGDLESPSRRQLGTTSECKPFDYWTSKDELEPIPSITMKSKYAPTKVRMNMRRSEPVQSSQQMLQNKALMVSSKPSSTPIDPKITDALLKYRTLDKLFDLAPSDVIVMVSTSSVLPSFGLDDAKVVLRKALELKLLPIVDHIMTIRDVDIVGVLSDALKFNSIGTSTILDAAIRYTVNSIVYKMVTDGVFTWNEVADRALQLGNKEIYRYAQAHTLD